VTLPRCNPPLAISLLFSGRRRHSAINGLAGPLRGALGSLRGTLGSWRLSSSEINRLLLLICSEVAPPSLSAVRVLAVPSAPSPVEVGPSGPETTAMEFPSVSVPVETCITDASHAACSKSVVGIAPLSTSVEVVSKTLPSVGYPLGESSIGESSIAASSGSTSGGADRSSSGSLDLSEEPLARVGSARSTLPFDRCLSGSLDHPAESLSRGGSAGSTAPVDLVTLDLESFA
jgi:hypothetical protein